MSGDQRQEFDLACATGMAAGIPVGGGSLDSAAWARICANICTEEGIKLFRREVELRDALTPDAQRAIQARLTAIYVQVKAKGRG